MIVFTEYIIEVCGTTDDVVDGDDDDDDDDLVCDVDEVDVLEVVCVFDELVVVAVDEEVEDGDDDIDDDDSSSVLDVEVVSGENEDELVVLVDVSVEVEELLVVWC